MIRIHDLSCGYDGFEVLHAVNLEIRAGDFAVILGQNGAGKSTLLHTLTGYLPVRQGAVFIKGIPLGKWHKRDLAKTLALIPQETVLPFDYTVEELVLMGRFPHLELLQNWSHQDYALVGEIMQTMDIAQLKDRFYSQLSGGEKQRVLLARALAQETEIICLDEALSQLDINHQVCMMQLLYDVNRKHGKTIILISHQINLAANLASRLIFLKSGKVVGQGAPAEVLTSAMLKTVFEVDLLLQTNPLSGRPNLVFPGVNP
jgi:iron complex transport system ATP-binding protein